MISFSCTDHFIRVKPRVLTRFVAVLWLEEAVARWGDVSDSLLEEVSAMIYE